MVGVPHRVPFDVPKFRPVGRSGVMFHSTAASPEVCPVKGCIALLFVKSRLVSGRVSVICSTGSSTSISRTKVAVAPEMEVTSIV